MPCRADEEYDHNLVKGGDEGEQAAGDNTGQDQGHLNLHKGCDRIGPQTGGGTHQASVKANQCGRHRNDHKGCAQGGMRQNHAPIGALQANAGIEEIHARGGDDQRHNHGRNQDRHDRPFEGNMLL